MSEIPNYLKFTPTHEWLDCRSEEMSVGITAHAQALLGDLVYIELPEVGKEVHMGEELGVVESVKAASDFYSPISGVVIATNASVAENPAIVNTDPYNAGWLVKLKATKPDELRTLLEAAHYQTEIAKED